MVKSSSRKKRERKGSERRSNKESHRHPRPKATKRALSESRASTNSNLKIAALKNPIKVALIGIGNVASAFVQAIYASKVDGIWHETIGGYKRQDIKIVAAFDVDPRKVGKDLSEAIFSVPNVTPSFSPVEKTGIIVQPGIANYEIPKHVTTSPVATQNFIDLLRASGANIVLNLIPSGMNTTSYEYAQAALRSECSFVNGTPSEIACDNNLVRKYENSQLVIAGDDILSQFGGTAFHKGILDFMNSRGLTIEKSYQLDVGGGSETLNTIDENIKLEKRNIKTESISEEVPYKFETVAGTTDYVDYMGNNRTSYFWIKARSFFDSDVKIDIYLRTNDAANAGNVLLDIIRAVIKSKSERRFGAPREICDYGFKKLPKPALLRRAHEEFLTRYS